MVKEVEEKSITLGISDWDELSSFILNHPESSEYLKGVAQRIREAI